MDKELETEIIRVQLYSVWVSDYLDEVGVYGFSIS